MPKKAFRLKTPEPDIEINKPREQSRWQSPWNFSLLYFLVVFLFFYFFQSSLTPQRQEIPYSQFQEYLRTNQVAECVVSEKRIVGTLKIQDERGRPKAFATVLLADSELVDQLHQHGVKYSVRYSDNWLRDFLVGWILPMIFIFAVWGFLSRRLGSMGGNFLNIGKHKAKIHANEHAEVNFDDVAGVEEAELELQEVIEFLRNPQHFQRLGGHMPKGVMLVGPPGTGKTLLAKAVAGEAGVPFFSISGSEFIEMFVGVGAARVRDLFDQARQKAPCIIFIDELDAIGRQRGGQMAMGGHDEREQTLNQLLVEIDGFDTSKGVVVLAATNRPEILDKALLRSGRFDRQIVVDKPDLQGREDILSIHTRGLALADNVDLHLIARRTPGLVGADLANIANEAAILAARRNQPAVTTKDFEDAIERILAGPEKKRNSLGKEEKHRVAYHEAGHALVAMSVSSGEPVHKVSIIPRGIGALGYTLQLPVKEKFLATRNELLDQIAVLLGGRVAEELAFSDVSTGAQNDLERASEIAHKMVCEYGMSSDLGPRTFGKKSISPFLGSLISEERNYSDETAERIDAEVSKLIADAHRLVSELLTSKRSVLDHLTAVLEEKEVLTGDDVAAIIADQKASGSES
ncbi:MAG: ATP-dependent zinc metalloprotease FtsH [Deltaproteobacteria bacterium]|nr:ATP-dependent zinc metalloprotease FtsH [Candidatus Anaeroferrophillus wilburensis]MBN2888063.1 ATP-dependent zinc metalloprotease FtsH [Deltaproteobacteria bacterium]